MRDGLRQVLDEAIADGLAALGAGRGERALVSGRGSIARKAADMLQELTGRPVSLMIPGRIEERAGGREAPEVDVLVDASGDPAWWASGLSRVRREGRVLLLVPPGDQVFAFDFYDRIHRSSLRVQVRRVPFLE